MHVDFATVHKYKQMLCSTYLESVAVQQSAEVLGLLLVAVDPAMEEESPRLHPHHPPWLQLSADIHKPSTREERGVGYCTPRVTCTYPPL